jgi:hypothetical protein
MLVSIELSDISFLSVNMEITIILSSRNGNTKTSQLLKAYRETSCSVVLRLSEMGLLSSCIIRYVGLPVTLRISFISVAPEETGFFALSKFLCL